MNKWFCWWTWIHLYNVFLFFIPTLGLDKSTLGLDKSTLGLDKWMLWNELSSMENLPPKWYPNHPSLPNTSWGVFRYVCWGPNTSNWSKVVWKPSDSESKCTLHKTKQNKQLASEPSCSFQKNTLEKWVKAPAFRSKKDSKLTACTFKVQHKPWKMMASRTTIPFLRGAGRTWLFMGRAGRLFKTFRGPHCSLRCSK